VLAEAQIERFSRHILLREVGGAGQERLLAATVTLDALGEAGRACALWLARAGVGTLGLPDDRSPAPPSDASGLLLASDAGRPLVEAVRERLAFHAPDARCTAPAGRPVSAGETVEQGVSAALATVRRIVESP
jgi:molybdopterin/thiamine biosynthesis adenylyltransferase